VEGAKEEATGSTTTVALAEADQAAAVVAKAVAALVASVEGCLEVAVVVVEVVTEVCRQMCPHMSRSDEHVGRSRQSVQRKCARKIRSQPCRQLSVGPPRI